MLSGDNPEDRGRAIQASQACNRAIRYGIPGCRKIAQYLKNRQHFHGLPRYSPVNAGLIDPGLPVQGFFKCPFGREI
jgi:hypothetical protein